MFALPVALCRLKVGIATGQIDDKPQTAPNPGEIRRVISPLRRTCGPNAGKASAESLTPKKRSDITGKAAARWSEKKPK